MLMMRPLPRARRCGTRGDHRGLQIHGEHLLPDRQIRVREVLETKAAGNIHQHVERGGGPGDPLHRIHRGLKVGQINPADQHVRRRHLVRSPGRHRTVIDEPQARAIGEEAARDCRAQRSKGPCDHDRAHGGQRSGLDRDHGA
jgi:hypothetical protein